LTSPLKLANPELATLVELLSLEKLEQNLFRGQSQDLGWGTVYGGQVLGQALYACAQTVPKERAVHSLHAYFLRPGDVALPVIYEVDRIRDGGSFTTRRVVAIQKGEAIFNMAASFQTPEVGLDHQVASALPLESPHEVPTEEERFARIATSNPAILKLIRSRPFDIRIGDGPKDPGVLRPVWMKTKERIDDNPILHAALLAYASDYAFLTTALSPHGYHGITPELQLASIDHVMWFHRPFRMDDWLLHAMESPSASSARGLVRGQVFSQSGDLVASTSQEGLMRKKAPR
jgi:acyl-CoA thioesterase II